MGNTATSRVYLGQQLLERHLGWARARLNRMTQSGYQLPAQTALSFSIDVTSRAVPPMGLSLPSAPTWCALWLPRAFLRSSEPAPYGSPDYRSLHCSQRVAGASNTLLSESVTGISPVPAADRTWGHSGREGLRPTLAKPTLAKKKMTDFGQKKNDRLWPTLIDRLWPKIGVADFGPNRLRPILLFGWGPEGCRAEGWGPEGWGPEGWAPKGRAPKGRAPDPRKMGPRRVGPRRVGGPKFRVFFPSSRHHFALLVSLLVESWWCLKRRDAQMCAFGVLGLFV